MLKREKRLDMVPTDLQIRFQPIYPFSIWNIDLRSGVDKFFALKKNQPLLRIFSGVFGIGDE